MPDALLIAAINKWIADCHSHRPAERARGLADLEAAKLNPDDIILLGLLARITRHPASVILGEIVRRVEEGPSAPAPALPASVVVKAVQTPAPAGPAGTPALPALAPVKVRKGKQTGGRKDAA